MAVNINLLKELIQQKNERLDELWPFEYDRYKTRADDSMKWANSDESWRKDSMKKAARAKAHGDIERRKAHIKDAMKARRLRKLNKSAAAETLKARSEIIKRGKSPVW